MTFSPCWIVAVWGPDGLDGRDAGLLGQELAERRVGHDERGDELGGQPPLVGRQVAEDPARDPDATVETSESRSSGALDLVEDVGRLVPERLPARRREPLEGLAAGVAQGRQDRLEEGRPCGERDGVVEGRIDRRDRATVGGRLAVGDAGGLGRRVVVLRLDRQPGGRLVGLGQDLARVR